MLSTAGHCDQSRLAIHLSLSGYGKKPSEATLNRRRLRWLPPIIAASPRIDPEKLRAATLRARRLGFGGKLCIHPKQIPDVNQCFRPTTEEIAWAKWVLEVAEAASGAAVADNGQMIDRPVILQAERILQEAERAAAD
jgi:citrate lyase subunit beta/citryl-CoA lyase